MVMIARLHIGESDITIYQSRRRAACVILLSFAAMNEELTRELKIRF